MLSCFKVFIKAGEDVICALAGLGVEEVYPSPAVLSGCKKFVCQLFKSGLASAKALRWHMFKQLKGNQGVEKLLPTQECITKHRLHAHIYLLFVNLSLGCPIQLYEWTD